jgi:hypothetical protein
MIDYTGMLQTIKVLLSGALFLSFLYGYSLKDENYLYVSKYNLKIHIN